MKEMRMLNIGTVVVALSFCAISGFAQINNAIPAIGKPFPEFSFANVKYHKHKNVSGDTFKNKWLFLDLWSLACRSCVVNISEMNSIKLAFKGKLEVLMVGSNDKKSNKSIEEFYDRLHRKRSLQLPAAFDSTLLKKWAVGSVPHIYVIDPNGVLRYVTDGRDITIEKVNALIKGEEVSFFEKEADHPKFVFEENGIPSRKDKMVYTSFITKWNGEAQNSGYDIDEFATFAKNEKENGWSLAAVPLYALYNYAYHGRWYWLSEDTAFYAKIAHQPILELGDSAVFEYSFDEHLGLGLYNYYLKMPPENMNQVSMMNALQESLKTTFGYEVTIENRFVPVWKLEASMAAGEELKTKGGNPICSSENSINGFTLRNCSMKSLMWIIGYHLPNKDDTPYLDETGIASNIDIQLDCLMPDRESVIMALSAHGLYLKKGTKLMKVMVIKEPLNARN